MVLDLATTVVARGRIMLYAKQNKPLEPGWAYDEQGRPTTDAQAALKGLLAPIGGYKGYGIALAIDMLCGVLTGSSFGAHFPGFLADNLKDPTDVGSIFAAIKVESFMDLPEFSAGMDQAIREIKACDKAEGVSRIYIPGEIELATAADRLANGIPIPDAIVTDFQALGQELAIPFPQGLRGKGHGIRRLRRFYRFVPKRTALGVCSRGRRSLLRRLKTRYSIGGRRMRTRRGSTIVRQPVSSSSVASRTNPSMNSFTVRGPRLRGRNSTIPGCGTGRESAEIAEIEIEGEEHSTVILGGISNLRVRPGEQSFICHRLRIVTARLQDSLEVPGQVLIQLELHGAAAIFQTFSRGQLRCVRQRRADILAGELRIMVEDRLRREALRQSIENDGDVDPSPPGCTASRRTLPDQRLSGSGVLRTSWSLPPLIRRSDVSIAPGRAVVNHEGLGEPRGLLIAPRQTA